MPLQFAAICKFGPSIIQLITLQPASNCVTSRNYPTYMDMNNVFLFIMAIFRFLKGTITFLFPYPNLFAAVENYGPISRHLSDKVIFSVDLVDNYQ